MALDDDFIEGLTDITGTKQYTNSGVLLGKTLTIEPYKDLA